MRMWIEICKKNYMGKGKEVSGKKGPQDVIVKGKELLMDDKKRRGKKVKRIG
jgi:hypothetical protein